jgi:hypothetical protein
MELNEEVRSLRLNAISNHEYNTQFTATRSYSKSRFGRDAEWIIALNMMSLGWNVKLSKAAGDLLIFLPPKCRNFGTYK